jgi:hypothetical protein
VVGREAEDTDDDWAAYYDDLARYHKNPRHIRPTCGPRNGNRMVHATSGLSE